MKKLIKKLFTIQTEETKIYKLDGKLIFDEPFLNLKEAVEKHKDDLTKANLKDAILTNANLEGTILD